jgi:hypothetical protein
MRHEIAEILLLWIALQIPLGNLVGEWLKAMQAGTPRMATRTA